MKRLNLIMSICVIGLIAYFTSCKKSDEFLTQINPNSVTPDSYWKTESDVDKWMTSAYSSLMFGEGGASANFARFFAWASIYRSDEYDTHFSNAWGQANADFTLDATNQVVMVLWHSFYTTIYRANEAIGHIPLMTNLTDQKRDELLGEAEFLRGFSYFYLINFWQKIPLITTVPLSQADLYPSQVEREVVWQQIFTDLTNATSHLSTLRTRDALNLGRATWGTALGHLAKAYLYHGDWQKSADLFKELIDSKVYDLVPNYRDNGNDLNENNIESLFEAQCNDAASPIYSTWRSRDGGPAKYAASQGVVEPWLVKTFLEEKTLDGEVDPRAYATLIFPDPKSTLYGGLTYEEAYGTLDPTAPAYWKKYRNVETRPNDNNGQASGINIRIMRFADVLLMHAEAENEAKGPTEAAQISFNRVRARANMAPVDPNILKDDFRTKIRRERVLELSGEENRWMDLKRWGILEERFKNPEVLSGKLFNISRNEYYPIPAVDIQTNKNLVQYADY